MIKHAEAIEHLDEFAVDALDEGLQQSVACHVRECAVCQSWLEAHELVGAALDGSHEHPSSEELALCATRPYEEFEPDHEHIRRHLEMCATCRADLELLRGALEHARPTPTVDRRPRPTRAGLHLRWAAAAATLGALAIAGALTVGMLHRAGTGSEPTGAPEQGRTAAIGSPTSAPRVSQLQDAEISGEEVIQTDEKLTIERLKIKDGATVTIRAAGTVTFGNGFHVEPGARMTVRTSG